MSKRFESLLNVSLSTQIIIAYQYFIFDTAQGFAATIPPSYFSQLQSLQGDGPIDYIGQYINPGLPTGILMRRPEEDSVVTIQ